MAAKNARNVQRWHGATGDYLGAGIAAQGVVARDNVVAWKLVGTSRMERRKAHPR
jgi:hypothetical protein